MELCFGLPHVMSCVYVVCVHVIVFINSSTWKCRGQDKKDPLLLTFLVIFCIMISMSQTIVFFFLLWCLWIKYFHLIYHPLSAAAAVAIPLSVSATYIPLSAAVAAAAVLDTGFCHLILLWILDSVISLVQFPVMWLVGHVQSVFVNSKGHSAFIQACDWLVRLH